MKNFTMIPNEILDESQLSITSRYLLCVLLRYCGRDSSCFPGQKKLGEIIGVSDRQIRNLLNELVTADLIIKKRTGFNKTNTYTVAKDYRKFISFLEQKNRIFTSVQLGSSVPLSKGSTIPTNNTHIERKRENSSEEGMKSIKKILIEKKVLLNNTDSH